MQGCSSSAAQEQHNPNAGSIQSINSMCLEPTADIRGFPSLSLPFGKCFWTCSETWSIKYPLLCGRSLGLGCFDREWATSMCVDDLGCVCILSELGRHRTGNLHVCYRHWAVCKFKAGIFSESAQPVDLFLIMTLSQYDQLHWPQWHWQCRVINVHHVNLYIFLPLLCCSSSKLYYQY